MIHSLVESLPPDEAAVWKDEMDVDLNPDRHRLDAAGGAAWVVTPGANVRRT